MSESIDVWCFVVVIVIVIIVIVMSRYVSCMLAYVHGHALSAVVPVKH